MSERIGLGASDVERRWIGVRRHQAVLAIVGVGLAGDWVTRSRASTYELVIGAVLLALTVPTSEGMSGAERVVTLARYHLRSRWTTPDVTSLDSLVSESGTARATRVFELLHRGRLDLSGRDVDIAASLQTLLDRMAATEEARHVSIRTMIRPTGSSTILVMPEGQPAPDGWVPLRARSDVHETVSAHDDDVMVLERWRYVRWTGGVATVLRVRDFNEMASERALLERIQFCDATLDLAVHVDVMGAARARRRSSRAVHGVSMDNAMSMTAGFRRTATIARRFERIRQTEQLVASGRSLLQLGVFVTLHANDLNELHRRRKALYRALLDSGLRCDRGAGRQAPWWHAQRSGGPAR